jgi:hypothetical protein
LRSESEEVDMRNVQIDVVMERQPKTVEGFAESRVAAER